MNLIVRGIQVVIGLSFLLASNGQECAEDGSCDKHQRCPVWRDEGECYRSPAYMNGNCRVSCRDKKTPPNRKANCIDIHENCSKWAEDAECETNHEVRRYCPLSCGRCEKDSTERRKKNFSKKGPKDERPCSDDNESCARWAGIGECDKNPGYMLENCRKACRVCVEEEEITTFNSEKTSSQQDDIIKLLKETSEVGAVQIADGDKKEETLKVVEDMMTYVESEEYKALAPNIKYNCKNRNELCAFWAAIGECEKNMSYMKVQCAPACRTCHLLDMNTRCPELPDAVPGLKPGDLNKLFERIVQTAPGNRTLTDADRKDLAESEIPEYSVVVHSEPQEGPWIITFDNFLTDEECDAMIQHGYEAGYKRSEDVGEVQFDGSFDSKKSKSRTSENAWCSTKNDCREKTIPMRLMKRIAKITGIPTENSEDFQILKYEVGQFYGTHHDYIPHQKDRQCGPRVLTFFLYLSDVEEGGGTDFPDLGITVTPKKGRAVLWPSVMNANPKLKDGLTEHQALPVIAGTKFGANAWIHLFDFQEPQRTGCN